MTSEETASAFVPTIDRGRDKGTRGLLRLLRLDRSDANGINVAYNQDTASAVSLQLIWRARNGILSLRPIKKSATGIGNH